MTTDRPARVDAIERATGVRWETWLAHFAQAGANNQPHAEIVKIAKQLMPDALRNPDWWAQGVAIAFEHQLGLRVPGGIFDRHVSAERESYARGESRRGARRVDRSRCWATAPGPYAQR